MTVTIRHRFVARLRAAQLDRQLARGVPPESSAPLEARAGTLGSPKERAQLAQSVRYAVSEASRERHSPLDPHVPLPRRQVLAVADDLRLLASRLLAPSSVSARGVAQARLLLSDGTGPLYAPSRPVELTRAVREAVGNLDQVT